ncbi:HupE/UreJ family protein [Pedobacter sp. MC2016-24]|uniref:HupE/UreJ family protein n=1 Tax=Pedobacter sp. MC2016-24 TaxID=2780090 RepID=UPI00187F239A|nr:HupE/UreJ family protein [Pedobacter sp. MC2016-24]MBE9602417.1 HupE/UreJ family protein [Pedobacter sp. MC2016-24]
MQDFPLYFELGWQHILDWQGYDHILFVMALCSMYTLTEWKKMLVLVTAFTIGHSITLALSVFNLLTVNTAWIEFLIPMTILITTLSNILSKRMKPKNMRFKYLMAVFFGLIHGLGFSNYLKSLLGKSKSIAVELLSFNLGLEFGQLIIVLATLLLSFVLIHFVKIKRWDWNFFLSSAIFGISFIMAAERFAALF